MEVTKDDATASLVSGLSKASVTLVAASDVIVKDNEPDTTVTGACVGGGVGDEVVGIGVGAGVVVAFSGARVVASSISRASSSSPQPWSVITAW
jgi:hypothetical protein